MNTSPIIDRCVSGAALAPLTSEQRQKLAMLARRAYAQAAKGYGDEPPAFDAWRHQQILVCTERAGIRECRQEDYDVVSAHFLRILGQAAMA